MTDLLVRLYDLPPLYPVVTALKSQKICIRRANPAEAEDISAIIICKRMLAKYAAAIINRAGRMPVLDAR